YPDPVAADFPDCLAIVEQTVKPEREQNKRKVRRERWWQFAERATDLYRTIDGMDRVLAIPLVSKHMIAAWVFGQIIFSHALGVIASDDDAMFAIIQSTIHGEWARASGSTLETRMRYTPSDCFET